jgi:hypothetical protein
MRLSEPLEASHRWRRGLTSRPSFEVYAKARVKYVLRSLMALLLILATLTLASLAHATDVDPGWGGLYDNGDFDDVILFITSAVGVADSQQPPDLGLGSPVGEHLLAEVPNVILFFRPRLDPSRAPPALPIQPL